MSASSAAFSAAFSAASSAAAPVVQVYRSQVSATQLYMDHRKNMFHQEQQANGGELEDPILLETISEEDIALKKAIAVAKFGQNSTIVGVSFIRTDALNEWFKKHHTHPLTNQPLGINPLDRRAEYAKHWQLMNGLQSMEDGEPFTLTPAQVQELFPIFLQNPTTFKIHYPVEHAWMQCHLKMGDTGVHMTFAGDASEQRSAALAYLANKPVGTGVFRLSSIQSTKLVECFAISYVSSAQKTARDADDQVVVIAEAQIRNVAIAHIMGYGYTIMGARSGQKLPEIENGVSNHVPIPEHDEVWASLLDLLVWFQANASNFNLNRMVLQV